MFARFWTKNGDLKIALLIYLSRIYYILFNKIRYITFDYGLIDDCFKRQIKLIIGEWLAKCISFLVISFQVNSELFFQIAGKGAACMERKIHAFLKGISTKRKWAVAAKIQMVCYLWIKSAQYRWKSIYIYLRIE